MNTEIKKNHQIRMELREVVNDIIAAKHLQEQIEVSLPNGRGKTICCLWLINHINTKNTQLIPGCNNHKPQEYSLWEIKDMLFDRNRIEKLIDEYAARI